MKHDPVQWRASQSPLRKIMRDAREFIADVTSDVDPYKLDDGAVMHTVRHMCAGGWTAFVCSDRSVSPVTVKAEIEQTFGNSFCFNLYK